jgi:DNA-directed RNA polymerase alpha subunit
MKRGTPIRSLFVQDASNSRAENFALSMAYSAVGRGWDPIETVEDLVRLSEKDLLKRKYCGRKSVALIKWLLAARGLSLRPLRRVETTICYSRPIWE